MLLIGGILGRRAIQILVGGSFQSTCWWEFSKAILKKFQPEVWDCLLDSENEGQENRGNTEVQEEKQELVASQTEVKICKVDSPQIQKNREKEDRTVDTEFDLEGDKVKHMGSLMGATAVKVHRSDGEDN